LPETNFQTSGISNAYCMSIPVAMIICPAPANRCGAAHVLFHQTHRPRDGFQVQPAGNQSIRLCRQVSVSCAVAPVHINQAGVRGSRKRPTVWIRGKRVPGQQIVAGDHSDAGPRVGRQACARRLPDRGRPHIRGRRVDQIAGQHFPFAEGADCGSASLRLARQGVRHRDCVGVTVEPVMRRATNPAFQRPKSAGIRSACSQ